MMRAVVITPPEPVIDLAWAKKQLHIDADDEDFLIGTYLAAATAHLDGPDGRLNRAIGPQVLEVRINAGWRWGIFLPYPPVIELVSASYLDREGTEQMADLSDLDLIDGNLLPAGTAWPWDGGSPRRDGVRIRYRAGYETLPPALAAAILLMAGDLYRNRETVAFGSVTQIPMSTTVDRLIAPFQVYC